MLTIENVKMFLEALRHSVVCEHNKMKILKLMFDIVDADNRKCKNVFRSTSTFSGV